MAFSQNPITISSSCETPNYLGTYNSIGTLNGKPSYAKSTNIDCPSYPDETSCGIGTPMTNYSIEWDGTSWTIRVWTCYWLFDHCAETTSTILFATNSSDTTLPPCTG